MSDLTFQSTETPLYDTWPDYALRGTLYARPMGMEPWRLNIDPAHAFRRSGGDGNQTMGVWFHRGLLFHLFYTWSLKDFGHVIAMRETAVDGERAFLSIDYFIDYWRPDKRTGPKQIRKLCDRIASRRVPKAIHLWRKADISTRGMRRCGLAEGPFGEPSNE